jgi:hypothetical protein
LSSPCSLSDPSWEIRYTRQSQEPILRLIWLYNYNASVVVPSLDHFFKLKIYFCFQNALG